MKKPKIASRGHHKNKAQAALKTHHKYLIRKRRPIHKRILLHPVSIFMMLCVGVFLVGWTIRTFAENITVTASVLAPLPAKPATIIKPIQQLHVTTSLITVSGTCPTNSYVKLFNNSIFSGTAICSNAVTTYSIITNLNPGTNLLLVRVFNITNNEGPQSTAVTVHYDTPKQAPASTPSKTPTTLSIYSLDSVSTTQGITSRVSVSPTVRGTAPPYSLITVTFHSTPVTCTTYSDAYGNWSCTLDQQLPYGTHTVEYSAVTPSGEQLTSPSHSMIATNYIAPLQQAENLTIPFVINYTYRYQVYASDKQYTWDLSLSNGTAPYALTITWGDGNSSTVVRNNTDAFQVNHTYELLNTTSAYHNIVIKAVDSVGTITNMQLPALVTLNGAQPDTAKPSLHSSIINFVKKWVWLIWPTYAVVLLMTTSFWLGEREEYIKIIKSAGRRRKR